MTFQEKLKAQWAKGKFVCVGLDPDIEEMNNVPSLKRVRAISDLGRMDCFLGDVVDATADVAGFFKPQIAFYEKYGHEGLALLERVCRYARAKYPYIPVIIDSKRNDIANTNSGYVKMLFEICGVDATTINPYLGCEAMAPFLALRDKGIIVLCKTSNPGSGEFQNLKLATGELLYERVAANVSKNWNTNGNCCLVVGATYPHEITRVREIAPELPFLLPGFGRQGAPLPESVRAARNHEGGFVANSARDILYAAKDEGEHYADGARRKAFETHNQITAALAG